MELIETAELLENWDTGLGREYGDLDAEHYRKLSPENFESFMEDVNKMVLLVLKLKDSNL